MEMRGFIFFSI